MYSEGRGHRFKSYRVRQLAISKKLQEHRVKLFQGKNAAVQKLISITLAMFLFHTAQAAPAKPTIASTSLCGDSYLLALAPDHISALSWQSRSSLSRATETHRALPQIWDDPEVLISTKADIILFGSGEGNAADILDAKAVKLTWGEDFATIEKNAGAITEALDVKSETIKSWTDRLDALKAHAENRSSKPKILYLSRSGGSAGKGTLVDAAITAAGGENIAEASGWFTPDPEQIIAYEPDLIITSYFKNGYESVQATAMRNKVVQRFISRYPSTEIDGNLWPCAGPGLIDAAELISEAIDALP